MRGFVQGTDRQQTTLLPECLDDWVGESNAVRAVDVFVDALELRDLGFDGVDPPPPARESSAPHNSLAFQSFEGSDARPRDSGNGRAGRADPANRSR